MTLATDTNGITDVKDHPESIPMVKLFMRDFLLIKKKIDDVEN